MLLAGLNKSGWAQQSASATYTSGTIDTDRSFTSTSVSSSCPGSLSVTIPVGAIITGVDVVYSMTAVGTGRMSQQRSQLRCVSTGGASEATLATGTGNATGTLAYSRTGLTIANGVSGGGTINFQLHAGRTSGGSGCNATYNYVNNNTWKVTVYYCNPASTPTLTASPTSICSGESTTLSIASGNLNSADHWQWYSGSCGGTAIGQGNSISVSPTSTTTYYARGEGSSCDGSTCGSVTVTVNLAVPDFTGTVTNATCPNSTDGAIVINKIPTAITFANADNDYISSSSFLSGRPQFTLEGWIKVNKSTIGNRIGLFGQNDAIEFGFISNTDIQIWTPGGGSLNVPLSSYPGDNAWHHIAAVGNGTNLIIYIDGVQAGIGGNTTSNYGTSTDNVRIGACVFDNTTVTTGGFTGQMLKVGFWSTALSAAQIGILASGFLEYTGSETGLLAGYNFYEGTGTTLTSLPAGKNGSFVNSPTWTAAFTYAWTKTGTPGYSATTKDISGLAVGDYHITVSMGSCNRTKDFTVSSVNLFLQWTGSINQNWNNAGNWACSSLPDITIDVKIPNVANKPVLSSGAIGSVKNIVIDNGSSVTVIGNTLQIGGTITNNGTFTATAGTIEMMGSAAQSISTGNFAGNTIQNLKISNPSGVTLLGGLSITGIVTANGTLNSGGNLTLLSTATQTALISGSGTGNVSGNVTMQRYLPDAFGYKYISSPFQAATVGELSDDMNLNAIFPTFYEYDEDRVSAGWVKYTTTTNVLYPMEGYAANFGSVSQAGTFDMSGVVSNGSVQLTLYNHNQPFTKGFNLIGNPYPSPIDWNAASGWTKTNIDNAVYYFNAGTTDQYTGTYSSYINGVSSDGIANGIIPSMQGFFVHVTDGAYPVAGALGATNSVRVNNLSPAYHKSTEAFDLALLRLSAGFDENGAVPDALAIYFDNLATSGFDSKSDALKLANTDVSVPNLYSISTDATRLSVNATPFPGEEIDKIPLGIKIEKSGNIIFKKIDLQQMPAGLKVYFSDAVTGINQDLELNPEYTVYLEANQYDNRFSIQFSHNAIENNPNPGSNFSAYSSNGKVFVRIYNLPENSGRLMLTNMLGQIIWKETVTETGVYEFEASAGAGVYLVCLISGNQIESKKLFIQH